MDGQLMEWENDAEVGVVALIVEELRNEDEDNERQRVYVNVQQWRELGELSFKEHFRMDRTTFQKLIVAVGHHLVSRQRMQRLRTPLDLCLLMALWPMFNQDTYRSAGSQFCKHGGDIHYHYRYIIKAISEMATKYIKWPSRLERDFIKTSFEENYGYPGVVGCMDGVHIEVTAPLEQPQRYMNRHDGYSVLVQAVCDHRLLYRDIYVGQPGSIGDARMFQRSPLFNNFLLRPDMFSQGEHILADGAYTLTDTVMTPYTNHANTTPRQRTHNGVLSSARSAVERSFALLRGKNRRLKKLPMRNHVYVIRHIVTSFVLHNFIILKGEEADGLPQQEMPLAHDEDHLAALLEEAKAPGG